MAGTSARRHPGHVTGQEFSLFLPHHPLVKTPRTRRSHPTRPSTGQRRNHQAAALVSARKVVSKVRAEMVAAATEMAVAEVVATEMAATAEMAAESSESIGRERHAAERENCGQCNE